MAYTVYVLRDKSGMAYVGTTSLPVKTRWNNGNGYRFCKGLWDAILRDGWASIHKEIVATNLDRESASKLEQELVSSLDSANPEHGYNREHGGVGKFKIISETSRKKMSESHTADRNPNFGKHFSETHKARLSDSNRGQKRKPETCERIGKSKQRPVAQYGLDGALIAIFASGRDAATATGTQPGHISKVCKHERKTAGGYVWAYV